jgi:hypothetical protein
VLQEEALNLEFDASLFFDELLAKASELTLGLLMFGGDCDASEESLCSVLRELAGIEGVGFGIGRGLSWRFLRGKYADGQVGIPHCPCK